MHYVARENEKKIRVRQIQRYEAQHNIFMTEFLKEKDLLMDALTDERFHIEYKPEKELTQKQLEKGDVKSVEYKGKQYLLYTDPFNMTILYQVLSPIYDDELFHWSENKRYDTMEATVVLGVFEFFCIFQKANQKGVVSVRYAKCDNQHKNKVTIAQIEDIYNADNDTFLDAIRQWKCSFENDVDKIKA